MIKKQGRYLVEQEVISIVINCAINAFIAWFLFRHLANVPLWGAMGEMSIMGDTIATCFLLPFFVCMGLTKQTLQHVEKKKVAAMKWSELEEGVLSFLPIQTFPRAVTFGILTTVICIPFTVAAFEGLDISQMPFRDFFILKTVIATVLAAIVTPLILIRALRDAGQDSGDK